MVKRTTTVTTADSTTFEIIQLPSICRRCKRARSSSEPLEDLRYKTCQPCRQIERKQKRAVKLKDKSIEEQQQLLLKHELKEAQLLQRAPRLSASDILLQNNNNNNVGGQHGQLGRGPHGHGSQGLQVSHGSHGPHGPHQVGLHRSPAHIGGEPESHHTNFLPFGNTSVVNQVVAQQPLRQSPPFKHYEYHEQTMRNIDNTINGHSLYDSPVPMASENHVNTVDMSKIDNELISYDKQHSKLINEIAGGDINNEDIEIAFASQAANHCGICGKELDGYNNNNNNNGSQDPEVSVAPELQDGSNNGNSLNSNSSNSNGAKLCLTCSRDPTENENVFTNFATYLNEISLNQTKNIINTIFYHKVKLGNLLDKKYSKEFNDEIDIITKMNSAKVGMIFNKIYNNFLNPIITRSTYKFNKTSSNLDYKPFPKVVKALFKCDKDITFINVNGDDNNGGDDENPNCVNKTIQKFDCDSYLYLTYNIIDSTIFCKEFLRKCSF
ncbi:hypothetical protein PACTADRAFT_18260 [Pachysolen tannophilus NRRL Y-2460]|uniref:Uncharacterized protein n=1 Tax=Pachysolen tannophilus NRRL Y-2460 TaxID=669874 RepID=A0A1E4TPC4_PACTA|nr:hypothetical protein PACTADRAFT_18260 [Pachysolen tannophilus NRRL Y-2460]